MPGPDSAFELHPQLAADTRPVGDLLLSRVLLMDNARFPWILLVPRRPGLREMIDLPDSEQAVLHGEIAAASRAMRTLFAPDKLNVAAIGNVVPQLHVHVVARFERDEAWPKPTFGFAPPVPYEEAEAGPLVRRLAAALGGIALATGRGSP
ncbi:MAG: HIT domain-containing protein [Alsobacter sp.]